MKTDYEILGLLPGTDINEIKKVYKRLALENHPDKNLGKKTEKFQEIKLAYERLTGSSVISEGAKLTYAYELEMPQENSIMDEPVYLLDNQTSKNDSEEVSYKKIDLSKLSDLDDFLIISSTKKEHYTSNFHKSNTLKYTDSFSNLSESELLERINTADGKYQKHTINNKKQNNYDFNIDQAFLWEAKKDGNPTIYIFNTMHTFSFDAEDIFGDALNHVLSKVDVVFTEVALKDDTLAAFLEFCFGADTLTFDNKIVRKAAEMGKQLKALENDKIRQIIGIKMPGLEILLSSQDSNVDEQYLTWVSPAKWSNISEENNETLPHIRRNKFWMHDILAEKFSSLVVCGANHSAGIWGLPNLLATEGYTLTPLMKKPPIPRSEIVRFLAFGNSNLSIFRSISAKPIMTNTITLQKAEGETIKQVDQPPSQQL